MPLPPTTETEPKPAPAAPPAPPVKPPEAPPAAPPADSTPPEPPPTPEELKREAKEMVDNFFSNPPRKKKTEEPVAIAPVADEPPPAEPPPGAPVEPPPAEPEPPAAPASAPVAPPPISEFAPAASRAIEAGDLDALVKTIVREQPKTPTLGIELKDSEKEDLAGFERLEKENPAMKGIAQKVVTFWQKETEFIENWEKENPGVAYNPDDHAAFYTKWSPNYDPDALEAAKRSNRADVETKIRNDERNKLRDEMRQEYELKDVSREAPVIAAQGVASIVGLVDADLIQEDPKAGVAQLVKKLEQDNPLLAEYAETQSEMLERELSELYKMAKLPTTYKPDAEPVRLNNGMLFSPVNSVLEMAQRLENQYASLPADKTLRNGRRFATHADYQAAIHRISSNKDLTKEQKQAGVQRLNGQYYTLEASDYWQALVTNRAALIKGKLDKAKPKTAAPAKPAPAPSTQTSAKPGDPAPAKAPPAKAPMKSVSSASSSDSVSQSGGQTTQGAITKEDVTRAFFT